MRPSASTPRATHRRDQLFALRDRLRLLAQRHRPGHLPRRDNRALVDALAHSGGRARGVATVKRSVTDAELAAMHDAGVRGTRFNFVKRLVDFTPKDELMEIAQRIAPLGWHVVSTSRRSTCRSSGISSPRCRPPWSSITWDGPT